MPKNGESLEALVARAAACVDTLELEEAVRLYGRARALAPDDVGVLDALAEAALQLGDEATAREALLRAEELAPEALAARCMNLGQLADDGAAALRWFERGVRKLRAERAALEQRSGDRAELAAEWLVATQSLASALCAAAELYMTDMCDEAEAEERCEALATEAVGLVSGLDSQTLAEPYQTLASLRLSQQRPEEAHPLVRKALGVVNDAEEGAGPSADARAAIAKLCMEVGESDDAVELLQALRVEDEDSLEIWYLLGCAALQADELDVAAEEVSAALAYAATDRCQDPQKGEWRVQLLELQGDVAQAQQEGGGSAS